MLEVMLTANQRKIAYPVTQLSTSASTIEFEYGTIDVRANTPAVILKQPYPELPGAGEVVVMLLFRFPELAISLT